MDRIGLLVELMGDKKAISSLQTMLKLKKEITNDQTRLRVDHLDARKKILELKRDLKELYSIRKDRIRLGMDTSDVDKRIAQIRKEISSLVDKKEEIRIDIGYDGQALSILNREINEVRQNAYSLRDVFSGIGQWASSIGAGLQSIGGIFDISLFDYAKQFATWKGMHTLVDSLDAAFTRFDTLNTYSDYMAVMGISADKAEKSLKKVDAVIQGLPIGLDEAALDVRRYSMFLGGDADKASKLVMGFDQALIAGGAPAQMRNYAQYELQRILASGDLATARQWMSLMNGLGVSTVFLKDAMGYANMSLNEFTDLMFSSDSPITGNDVIEGFVSLADDKGLKKMIDIYRGTLESGFSNLHYAVVRGEQKVFSALDELFVTHKGMHISDYIYEGRDLLNKAFLSVADWVSNNPETIFGIMDRLEGLLDRAGKFDWGKMASSVIGGFEQLFDIFTWVYDHIPEGAIQKFLTFSLVWASPLGKAFTAVGNLFTTLAFLPFPRFGAGFMGKGMSGMGRFVTSLKSIGTGFLGASAYIGIIAEIGAVIYEYAKVAETVAHVDLNGFERNYKKLALLGTISSGLAGVLTTIFSGISAIPGGAVVVGLGELLSAGFVGIIGEIGAVIGEYADVASKIANAKLPSNYKLQRTGEVFASFAGIFGGQLGNIRINQWKIKQLTSSIDLVNQISEVLPQFNKIAEAKIRPKRVKERFETMVGVFKEFSSLMSAEFWASDAMKTNQHTNIIDSFVGMFTSINTALGELNAVSETMKETGLFKKNKKGKTRFEKVAKRIEDMVEAAKVISDAVSDNTGILGNLKDKIVTGIRDDIVKNYSEIIDAVGELGAKISEANDLVTVGTISDSAFIGDKMVALLANIRGAFEEIDGDIGAFSEKLDESKWRAFGEKIVAYQTVITGIINIVKSMQENADVLAWGGNTSRSRTAQQRGASGAFGNLGALIRQIDSIAVDMALIGNKDFDSLLTNLYSMNTALDTLMEITEKIQGMTGSVQNVTGEGPIDAVGTLITKLTTIFGGGEGAGAIGSMVENMNAAIEAAETINSVLGEMTGIFNEAAAEADSLKTNISDLADVSKSKEDSFSGMIAAMGNIADVASTAAANVSSLASAINSLQSKNVVVSVSLTGFRDVFNKISLLRSLSSIHMSSGGVVHGGGGGHFSTGGRVAYLAGGGSPFKPKGTDTVPAMLTPGEWVINRKAAKMFGNTFMKRVNSMDIEGAMSALMSRAHWLGNGRTIQTVNNYDNHATVNQHFHDYKDSRSSYRRASRYVGAL